MKSCAERPFLKLCFAVLLGFVLTGSGGSDTQLGLSDPRTFGAVLSVNF